MTPLPYIDYGSILNNGSKRNPRHFRRDLHPHRLEQGQPQLQSRRRPQRHVALHGPHPRLPPRASRRHRGTAGRVRQRYEVCDGVSERSQEDSSGAQETQQEVMGWYSLYRAGEVSHLDFYLGLGQCAHHLLTLLPQLYFGIF